MLNHIKITDNRPLSAINDELFADIMVIDNQILSEDEFDQNELDLVEYQAELAADMESMCEELGIIQEVMALKHHVDCDCFYDPCYED